MKDLKEEIKDRIARKYGYLTWSVMLGCNEEFGFESSKLDAIITDYASQFKQVETKEEVYPKDFVEWMNFNVNLNKICDINGDNPRYRYRDNAYNLVELFTYYLTNVKNKRKSPPK